MTSLMFRLLIAASLLAHTVLGCCWHHAHAGGCRDEGVAAVECHGHCRAEPDVDEHSQGEQSGEMDDAVCGIGDEPHGSGTACDEPDCSYIKSRTTPEPAMGAPVAAATWDVCTVPAVHRGRSDSAGVAPHARGAAAALRAALQLWLI